MAAQQPPEPPRQPLRERAALVSYWVFFILLPLAGFLVWRGVSAASLSYLVPLFVVLVVIGEHGLRPWRRWWWLA